MSVANFRVWPRQITTSASLVIALMFFAVAGIGCTANETLKSTASPDGKLRADVVEISEGALGGSTKVTVFRVSAGQKAKKLRDVYHTDRGAEIALKWADSRTLLVNAHTIDVYKSPLVGDASSTEAETTRMMEEETEWMKNHPRSEKDGPGDTPKSWIEILIGVLIILT